MPCGVESILMRNFLFLLVGLALAGGAFGQQLSPDSVRPGPKSWTEAFVIRGYVQTRYNRLLETNAHLQCEQCDRSWGDKGGFSIRRARLTVVGNLNPRVYINLQADFASTINGTLNWGQVRDAYADIALDDAHRFRLRLGQSKLPYGFENMQSSGTRLPLDRADAINSAIINERDVGVFFYYAPAPVRELFRQLATDGRKGSGDYGVVGLGVYNGQGANFSEQDNRPQIVGRVAYPFQVGGQIIEPGLQGYTGRYVVANHSAGVGGATNFSYLDQRAAVSLNVYPQPFGLMAEWNLGRGPEYNPATDSIELRRLHGGYVQLYYRQKLGTQELLPFVRGQYYEGGKKFELDARRYRMREFEVGVEWQLNKNFELTTQYTISRRRFEDHIRPNNLQNGSLLRVQAQVNY